jgi:hypothetical protein
MTSMIRPKNASFALRRARLGKRVAQIVRAVILAAAALRFWDALILVTVMPEEG